MNTRTHRAALALSAACLAATGVLTGCGNEDHAQQPQVTSPAPISLARARQVAEAWEGSDAAEAWRHGYHPLGEQVQLPKHGLRTEADQRAWLINNFELRGELPSIPKTDQPVRWENGDSLARPVKNAVEVYDALDRTSSSEPPLVVTGAELGEMVVATTRGPATVPAWLFSLADYDTPLKRAAVKPSELPESPIEPAREESLRIRAVGGLAGVSEDGQSVTVFASHGSCDDGPAVKVLETSGAVVLSAYVTGTSTGPCTSDRHYAKVTKQLNRPLGDRVLLDAFTGRPVSYGKPHGPPQSWS